MGGPAQRVAHLRPHGAPPAGTTRSTGPLARIRLLRPVNVSVRRTSLTKPESCCRCERRADSDRVLATILFTDVVGSTERAAALGDRRWRDILEQYYAVARRELARFRGREVDTAGDGLFAAFDGPARAIRCAWRIRDAVRALDIELRTGLHANFSVQRTACSPLLALRPLTAGVGRTKA